LIRADLHIHTTFSNDSQINPKTLVDLLIAHPTIKAAAVTDHNSVAGLNILKRLAEPHQDILILPGVEITTSSGDILLLGTEQLPPKPWTIENVVDFSRKTECLSIAAHPFREWGIGDLARYSGVNAIEVLNGGSSVSANKQARRLAKELNLPGVAGSDSHKPSELFSVYTQIQASLNVDEILNSIRKGKVAAISTEKSIRF
jgi:predicted metal-dependent phosphoesterase TrpH